MHNPYDENGKEIDAKYYVEIARHGFDLIIESQGGATGGRPPRNTEYALALVLHLRRMAELEMVLDDLQVASKEAMKHPENERQIRPEGYTMPLKLGSVTDFEKLRLAIGRVSAAYKRKKNTGGNPTKKLKLRIRWPDASNMSADSIASLLSHSVTSQKPTADPIELAERVERARKRIRAKGMKRPKGQGTVPRFSVAIDRYVRDPEVIAWILEEAAGNCEHCGAPAPFKRMDGKPFLEVHHVRPLGEGGPDTVENAAACCPNCHRRLHFDPDKDSLRRALIVSVKRLKDFPIKV